MNALEDMISTLKNAREAALLSQRDVARSMGMESAASVCQWETGAKRPRADNLIQWAGALGYDLALVPCATAPPGLPG